MLQEKALIKSIEAEYLRYRALAEAALAQAPEAALSQPGPAGGNSLAVLCRHVSGNLKSRFTDFLTSDGEKPWRQREEEFSPRAVSRAELTAQWADGWQVLMGALAQLADGDLTKTVVIRGRPLLVHEALHRSLAHMSYHVGQIVHVARALCGDRWRYLSIPPGGSAAYRAGARYENPAAHASALMPSELDDFARRYAGAWCSQDPASVASFFAEDGSLSVNDGAPAVGRAAIAEVARGFMTAFPDMVVSMDRLVRTPRAVEFHWTLTGTNSGPGGTGRRVRISGYEEWQMSADGLVAASRGHFDAADYERQLREGVAGRDGA